MGRPASHPRLRARGRGPRPGLLAAFLEALEERVADAPDRYRWDYIEALLICRKADGTRRDQTRPESRAADIGRLGQEPSKPLDLTRLNG